jgi:DNA-binding response OmpR family regulator
MARPTMKILIIDDDVDLLESVAKQVNSFPDYIAVTASTVEEATAKIKQVDAVLADVNLPGKDLLNQMLEHCPLPVVRFSAQPQTVINMMLSKPFTSKQLKEAIEWLRMFQSGESQAA